MATSDNPARSESLLPAAPDPRLEVAEEVALDLQSDSARQVGAAPAGPPGEALATALQPPAPAGQAGQAPEHATPRAQAAP